MNQIQDEPVRAAFDKLKHLSADAEARRLAFVRERALFDERMFLREAREDGLAEGREAGRVEGIEAGQRRLILNLLQRRFGPLAEARREQVDGLRGEQLAALGDALLDFATAADLDAWLNTQPPPGNA